MYKSEQLPLDLPQRAALGRDDFLVSPSNAAAVRLVDDWPNWPAHGAILIGPPGSGKSHLAQVWQAKSKAKILTAQALNVAGLAEDFVNNALAIEKTTVPVFEETALFHALNLAKQRGGHVLITAQAEPSRWGVALPDLASRLNALPLVHILPPDDALLRGVLVKLFADRQIAVDEPLVNYMVLRMPRSLSAARELVAAIDAQALAKKAEITRPFVAKVMAGFDNPDLFTN